jgi:monoamine oxidase
LRIGKIRSKLKQGMVDVLVIGAGAAGLTAAYELSCAGAQVEILEARNRIGGRIWTVPSSDRFVPLELGAEFIHGNNEELWDMIRRGGFGVRKVPDEHWEYPPLAKKTDFWDSLEGCISGIDLNSPDKSFDEYLREHPCRDEWAVRLFVEGFDAADTRKISSHALKKASEDEGQDKVAWLERGYSLLIDWLTARAREQGAIIQLQTRAHSIRWRAGDVEIRAQTNSGEATWRAERAIITLPVGVLKAKAISFEPELPLQTQQAIDGMQMGGIVKILFEFEEAFWKDRLGSKNFGFIHSQRGPLRTWWSRAFAPILVGWVGGPAASAIGDHVVVVKEALQQLCEFVDVPVATMRKGLRQWRSHNWIADQFACGAYSYIGVGNIEAPQKLAEPIEDTLFFAGEATSEVADLGTVHGAIESGMRAARQAQRVAV